MLLQGQLYFSGKHKLHGYTTEMSMARTVQAINATDNKHGSIFDLFIFQCNLNFHNQVLIKYGKDKDIANKFLWQQKFPENWAVLKDKEYQDAQQQVKAIIPKKKPYDKILSLKDESWNAIVVSNCIIVENYFGHLTKLWGIILSKYRWAEEGHDVMFCLGVALPNYHISAL